MQFDHLLGKRQTNAKARLLRRVRLAVNEHLKNLPQQFRGHAPPAVTHANHDHCILNRRGQANPSARRCEFNRITNEVSMT